MSVLENASYSHHRKWKMLEIYNIYRLAIILIFLLILINSPKNPLSDLYYSFLAFYFICSLYFFYLCVRRALSFEYQVFITGSLDVLAISFMLSNLDVLETGLGIVLNVSIAALSILVPGRLAIYYASLGACFLLFWSVIEYQYGLEKDIAIFFYSGIYGAGFFATALTAWYLASIVNSSEQLAKRRSDELAEMKQVNEYIVEALHSGVIYISSKQQILLINSAARRFFKLGESDNVQTLSDLPSNIKESYTKFLKKSEYHSGVAQTILMEPYLKMHLSKVQRINDAVLITLDDMTEVSKQAQQMKLASLGRFSASIAHELRNPLGAISHAIQFLDEDKSFSKENMQLIKMIMSNCNRMNMVINNVLQISRREQSRPEKIMLKSFLESFKDSFIHQYQCAIELKLAANAIIYFDKSQLEQILVILCENAVVHNRQDKEQVQIRIFTHESPHQFALKIADNGKGISTTIENDIFEPFYTSAASGTGMGLFIARDFCEINEARLVYERSDSGACFAIIVNKSKEFVL